MSAFAEFAGALHTEGAPSQPPDFPRPGPTDEETRARDYVVRFGEAIDRGWRVVMDNFWFFVGVTAVHTVICLAAGFIPYVGIIAAVIVNPVVMAGFWWICIKRMLRKNIMERNWLSCLLADVVFVPFAEKGTKTFITCKRVVETDIPMFTCTREENKNLHALGVPALTRKNVGAFIENLGASTTGEPPFPQPAYTPPVVPLRPEPARSMRKRQINFWETD
ncbi:MAG: hypothetical protein ABIF82_13145 [Planctomycetota bacterium]